MKKSFFTRAFALVLTVLMLTGVCPVFTSAATNADWKIDGSYAILAGGDLYNATTSSNTSSKAIAHTAGKTYVSFGLTSGTKPYVDVTQSLSGVNFASYDYYVISYVQYGADGKVLDTTFRSDAVKPTDYANFPYDWYETWSSIGHPAASNGSWKIATLTRAEMDGMVTNCPPISTLTNQLFRFKPTQNTNAGSGASFGLEFIACFKTKAQADAFVEMYNAKSLPVECLNLTRGGNEVTEVTIKVGKVVPVTVEVFPEYSTGSAQISFSGDCIQFQGDIYRAVKAGKSTMTVTAGGFTKTVDITVEESDANYVIVDAAGIANDIVPSASFTSVKSIVEDDAAMKRLVRFDITSNSSVTSDHTYIAINLNGDSSVKIKDYPYVKIGYRAKLNGAKNLDFNTNIDKYYKQGSASNVVSNRFWGPMPTITQNAFSSLNIEYTKYNGCEQGGGYNWSWVADDAKYTRLLLKPFHSNGKIYAGDFFEIEYIGFFASKEGMETYEHKTSLESFSVEPTLTVEQGTFKKLPLIIKPASAYVKIKYSSNNESVATVSENGNVIGLKAGTAKITATTSDNAYSADCTVTVTAAAKDYSRYIFDRDDLENLKYKLNVDKKLNVVYLGGSVTAGAGASNGNLTSWRGITGNWLVSMFPDAKITNVNSAMGGSGSMLGAFRLYDDVIAHNPDLVFVEFAVNDGYSGHKNDGTIGMYYEYIIRTLREKCPNTEIISLYVVDQADLGTKYSDALRQEAQIHDAIAQKYGVTGLSVGRAMCDAIHETGSAWSDYVADSVHPADKGYAVYGNVVKQYLFDKLFVKGETPTELKAHTVPSTYYDARTKMFNPKYVRITGTDIFKSITGWTWNAGKVYSNLDTAGYIYPSAKTNSFTYEFVGTAIGLYYEFAGGKYNIEYSIDGGTPKTVYVSDTNHPFNKIVKGGVASEELEYGKHTLTFSYKGAGANSSLKLTRILVQDITGTDVIGDVNNDFAVDALDATALTRAVAGWASYQNINFDNGDVNDDNKVDAFDVLVLSRHLADWKGYDKYFAD